MVNNNDWLRRIPFELAPRPLPADRKLPGPRYHLDRVLSRVTPQDICLLTAQCRRDVLALRWDTTAIDELIHFLEPHHYRGSEWCETGVGLALDCDAYALKFDIRALVPSASGLDIYIKYGFTLTSKPILIVSCHP